MINLEVNGSIYKGFTSVNVSESMDTLTDKFNYTASTNLDKVFPFWVQDKVKVLIGNTPIVTGYIDKLSPNSTNSDYSVAFAGRDKTSDILDSTIDGNMVFKAPINLKTIIEKVISSLGISDIKVIPKVSISDFASTELVAGKVGENAFQFINKFCKKRQVVISSNGDGNIILDQATKKKIPLLLLKRRGGANNNIINSNADYDATTRFYKNVVYSQGNTTGGLGSDFSGVKGTATDKNIRKTRTKVIKAKTSSTGQTAEEYAKWIANIGRAKGFSYQCTVNSFFTDKDHKNIWKSNTLVEIQDDYCFLHGIFLLRQVSFSETPKSLTTTLNFVRPDAYTLQASQDEKKEKYSKAGQ